jgi:hypothetical protein
MTSTPISAAAVAAAPLSVASSSVTKAGAIARASHDLLLHLERGQRIDAPVLRAAMESAFGASDADGGWNWKMAYDACEAATVLFVRKFGPAMRARAASPAAMLPMLAKIDGLLPTHTRRSEESEALQQFSTPFCLGLLRPQRLRSRQMTSCWSLPPALVCSQFWPSFQARRWFSMNSQKPAQNFSRFSFPASPLPVLTPRISTIISTLASRQASS